MRIDHEFDKAHGAGPARPRRRKPWLRLISTVLELAGPGAELVRHTERPWASVTFSGSRHTVTLRFGGEGALESGDLFIEALPEHEFAIPGQLVADAAVISVDQVALPEPAMTVEIELLLLEEV